LPVSSASASAQRECQVQACILQLNRFEDTSTSLALKKLIRNKFPRETQLEVNRIEHRSGTIWKMSEFLVGLDEFIQELEKLDDRHTANTCQYPTCRLCGGKHHEVLCNHYMDSRPTNLPPRHRGELRRHEGRNTYRQPRERLDSSLDSVTTSRPYSPYYRDRNYPYHSLRRNHSPSPFRSSYRYDRSYPHHSPLRTYAPSPFRRISRDRYYHQYPRREYSPYRGYRRAVDYTYDHGRRYRTPSNSPYRSVRFRNTPRDSLSPIRRSEESGIVTTNLIDQTNKPLPVKLRTREVLTKSFKPYHLSKEDRHTLRSHHIDPDSLSARRHVTPDIDMLGIDYFWEVLKKDIPKQLPSGLMLVQTRFGSVVSGSTIFR
ncbi:hypothetical protein ANCCAN_01048, partial [Ancylostoma caninum]